MIGIFREELYSPNHVQDDAAILELTAAAIREHGYPVETLRPEELTLESTPDMAFAMCTGPRCLQILKGWESKGYRIVNSPSAAQNCHRYRMHGLMNGSSILFPKSLLIRTTDSVNGQFDLGRGVWVKRGDVHRTHPRDVELVFDRASLEDSLEFLCSRWVEFALLQEHIEGDLIKFYGVLPQSWFRYVYQTPEKNRGYPFSPEKLRNTAEAAARKLGLEVYGGDIVVTETDHFLIDINNWPSFGVCREEASEQIASYLVRCLQRRVPRCSDLRWRSARGPEGL